ncbi:MAG: YihY/virulence factor BrkB family protein [Lachnospiraceae bacterium]|nr:YihY/virulence factor BrkB family protein [Lachnospiraceae bacterium]
MIIQTYHITKDFLNKLNKHNVGAFASQAAFFIMLSVFPFISLLLNLVKYTPITKDFIFTNINKFIPEIVHPLTNTIIDEMYANTSSTAISLTVLLGLWSAGKGVLAIIYGLDSVYEVEEKRNYFVIRIISALYTLLFIVAIIICLGLMVFGNTIYRLSKEHSPIIYDLLGIFINRKEILTFLVLILFFLIVYKVIPQKNYSMLTLLPGACFSSIGWVSFSFFFSLYIKYSDNYSYTYGSLATIIISMMWIYICMYILFIGAEINIYFRDTFSSFFAKIFKRHH